mmetsp:Transcript_11694/g.21871  ORF Transcript_11694/g.21871 Transcript_11694/m.21871 type:complete len:463 (-) Transcript_11694:55-1443(-)
MSSHHGRFPSVDDKSDRSSSRNQNEKEIGSLKSANNHDCHDILTVERTLPLNAAELQATTVKTPINRKSEDILCQSKSSEQRLKNQLTPQCTPMSSGTHTNQLTGRMKSSGMKGKARRIALKRPDETNAMTPLQSSITSLCTTTHPITPSPRGASSFSFDSKVSSTAKIREMKNIRSVTSSKECSPTVVDVSSSASISNRLCSLSLKDEKRKGLSSGARRVPLGSLTKRVNKRQVEELSLPKKGCQLSYTFSHHDKEFQMGTKENKVKQLSTEAIVSLKDDFMCERTLATAKECEQGKEASLSMREAMVDEIRSKLKNEKETKINEDLLDGCISYQENLCNLLHSSLDSDDLIESPQKDTQSPSSKLLMQSKANESFDSLSEHFRVVDDEKKSLKKEVRGDGSVNPMSKTLSRDDAELLFRAKALSRHFSFSGSVSAFSANITEMSRSDVDERGISTDQSNK